MAADTLYPAQVRLVDSPESLHAALPEATVLVVESMPIGTGELARAPRVQAIQNYGNVARNIDADACAARGIPLLRLRRPANIACAEQTLALMFALAKRLPEMMGSVPVNSPR